MAQHVSNSLQDAAAGRVRGNREMDVFLVAGSTSAGMAKSPITTPTSGGAFSKHSMPKP